MTLLPNSKSKIAENYKVNNIGWRCIKLRMYLLYRIFCFKSNLAEFLALYGGNLDFLDKFLALAYARTKNLSKKSQFPP